MTDHPMNLANGQLVTGFWLKLANGNRLRFHAIPDMPGEPDKALEKAYVNATKDRQRWYASEQFPGQHITIEAGVR